MKAGSKSARLAQALLRPEILFLIIGAVFGLGFCFITPPFQVADEYHHFFRAFQVSEGRMFGRVEKNLSGGDLPASISAFANEVNKNIPFHPQKKQKLTPWLRQFYQPLNPGVRWFLDFRGSVLYSPVPYFPQALAIGLGSLFNLPPIVLFYLGRLANLAAWLYLTYLAVRLAPIFKWVLVFLALAPMSLFQAASNSADGLTHALSFLLIAYILYLALDEAPAVTHHQYILLVLLAVLLALCKQAYILLLGLYLVIPARKFGGWRRYLGAGLLMLVLAVAVWGLWSRTVSLLYLPTLPDPSVNPGGQVWFILKNPLGYLKVLGYTFVVKGEFFSKSYIGLLGWLDTQLPNWIYLTFIPAAFLLALFDHDDRYSLAPWQQAAVGLVFFGGMALIATTLYMIWTPVGNPTFEGVQGRYFIPLAPLFLLLFYNHKLNLPDARLKLVPVCYIIVVLAATAQALVLRYYYPG